MKTCYPFTLVATFGTKILHSYACSCMHAKVVFFFISEYQLTLVV